MISGKNKSQFDYYAFLYLSDAIASSIYRNMPYSFCKNPFHGSVILNNKIFKSQLLKELYL